ncbi:MAG: hypothetical protein K2Q09_00580, partial [Phycisphaerales bacterium]|nr:hypothetical protein [Phycisphaerales bacterium]
MPASATPALFNARANGSALASSMGTSGPLTSPWASVIPMPHSALSRCSTVWTPAPAGPLRPVEGWRTVWRAASRAASGGGVKTCRASARINGWSGRSVRRNVIPLPGGAGWSVTVHGTGANRPVPVRRTGVPSVRGLRAKVSTQEKTGGRKTDVESRNAKDERYK